MSGAQIVRAALLWLLLAGPAIASTPCPTVSTGVSILSVNIVGAPLPVGFAGLDLETGYLTISFTNGTAQMFIGVPQGAVQGFQMQWASLSSYHQAIMQQRSTCPLLNSNGLPIWSD